MSTIPPNSREGFMRAATVNMAMAQPAKAKAPKANNTVNAKAKTQMHRRSRTGSQSPPYRSGAVVQPLTRPTPLVSVSQSTPARN